MVRNIHRHSSKQRIYEQTRCCKEEQVGLGEPVFNVVTDKKYKQYRQKKGVILIG